MSAGFRDAIRFLTAKPEEEENTKVTKVEGKVTKNSECFDAQEHRLPVDIKDRRPPFRDLS